jgi:hypothetical protein
LQILPDFEGRSIRLTGERIAHLREHPEMTSAERWIVETLLRPSTEIQSVSDPSVHLYYRRYLNTTVGAKWLCVVVKLEVVDPFIITAYLTDKPKRGTTLWQEHQ